MQQLKLLIIIISLSVIAQADTIEKSRRYLTGNATLMKSLDAVYGVGTYAKWQENYICTDNYYAEIITIGTYKPGKTKPSIDFGAKYQASTIKTKDISGDDLNKFINDNTPTKTKEIK